MQARAGGKVVLEVAISIVYCFKVTESVVE